MPYNTRRKSLSLSSLGIHVPITNAARAAAKTSALLLAAQSNKSSISNTASTATLSPPITDSVPSPTTASTDSDTPALPYSDFVLAPISPLSAASSTMPSTTSTKRPASGDASAPSSKRSKQRNPSLVSVSLAVAKAKSDAARVTPPMSPKRHASIEFDAGSDKYEPVDMDNISDDIVEGVVQLLQESDNRPHLIKELENKLMRTLRSVQASANPSAIISSRLTTFMKRACWTEKRKCPLAKQLEDTHPRRTYYYLTTCPHQPLPDPTSVHFIVPKTSIVTPPMSSAPSSTIETEEEERRRELSPSPEFELIPDYEFDDDRSYLHAFSTNDCIEFSSSYGGSRRFIPVVSKRPGRYSRRGVSPPLERDEREFTQTAEGLQRQKKAGNRSQLAAHKDTEPTLAMDKNLSSPMLFGQQYRLLTTPQPTLLGLSSPVMRPQASASTADNNTASAASVAKTDLDAAIFELLDQRQSWKETEDTTTLFNIDEVFAQI